MQRLVLGLYIFALANSSCSDPTKVEKTTAPTNPILHIEQKEKGIAYGESVFLRLFSDGSIEFDWFDATAGLHRTTGNSCKAKASIDTDKLDKLVSVISSPEFGKLNSKYSSKLPCMDQFVDYTIRTSIDGKEKLVELENFCSLGDVTSPKQHGISDVPRAISTLFKLADQARSKHLVEKGLITSDAPCEKIRQKAVHPWSRWSTRSGPVMDRQIK